MKIVRFGTYYSYYSHLFIVLPGFTESFFHAIGSQSDMVGKKKSIVQSSTILALERIYVD